MSKRDRFGIHAEVERLALQMLEYALTAAFEHGSQKGEALKTLRIKAEVAKRFLRNERALNILPSKIYLAAEKNLQDISKMANGWLKYLNAKGPA